MWICVSDKVSEPSSAKTGRGQWTEGKQDWQSERQGEGTLEEVGLNKGWNRDISQKSVSLPFTDELNL